jgi:UDP-GlcNAc3NAcA epimerase
VKIVSVVGARPQFIKAAPISRFLREKHNEVLVHTGQHYDENMSDVFFADLDIPPPKYNLGIGSASHGVQTGAMLRAIEEVLIRESPNWVLVYGDTNSTLAGSLAAAKLNIDIAHIEAGLRSYNRSMPEEINRILTDHLSTLLLCPSQVAVTNLAREGIIRNVYMVGDVMADALAFSRFRSQGKSKILDQLKLKEKDYLLATVHRAENTDDVKRINNILSAFSRLDEYIVFPVHPRTRRVIESSSIIEDISNIHMIEPVGYLDMIRLEDGARMILTDSGGIQKEAYWLRVPCVTLRDETEWVETVEAKWNVLVGANPERIMEAVRSFVPPASHPQLYGGGCSAQRCVELFDRYIT